MNTYDFETKRGGQNKYYKGGGCIKGTIVQKFNRGF